MPLKFYSNAFSAIPSQFCEVSVADRWAPLLTSPLSPIQADARAAPLRPPPARAAPRLRPAPSAMAVRAAPPPGDRSSSTSVPPDAQHHGRTRATCHPRPCCAMAGRHVRARPPRHPANKQGAEALGFGQGERGRRARSRDTRLRPALVSASAERRPLAGTSSAAPGERTFPASVLESEGSGAKGRARGIRPGEFRRRERRRGRSAMGAMRGTAGALWRPPFERAR